MKMLGKYLLGPNDENQGIYTGDARDLAKAIPDESVDLIFTDPVYQNIDDYCWLAEMASRALEEGHLLVYVTQEHLPKQLDALNEWMAWGWLFGIQLFGRRAPMWKKKIQACGQLIAWYYRNEFFHPDWADDFIGVNARQKKGHEWRKGLEETMHYINAFSDLGDIILDPFTGGGTVPAVCKMLGRHWLAFEIDPNTAESARQRVSQTQPPLPGLVVEQLGLGGM